MTDRILTESPWNALFDNLPGIAQQINQAMMQRKQQQLDQQNINRQFAQRGREIELRGAQLKENKRQAEMREMIDAYRITAEKLPPDASATLFEGMFAETPIGKALSPAYQAAGKQHAQYEETLMIGDRASLAQILSDSDAPLQVKRAAESKIAELERVSGMKSFKAEVSTYEGTPYEDYAKAASAQYEAGDKAGAIRNLSRIAEIQIAESKETKLTKKEKLAYWSKITEESALFPYAQERIKAISEELGIKMPEAEKTVTQWVVDIETGESTLDDVPEELKESVSKSMNSYRPAGVPIKDMFKALQAARKR